MAKLQRAHHHNVVAQPEQSKQQHTASNITRGFMSEAKSPRRSVKHDRERDCGSEIEIAVVFMVSSSGREVTARELPRCLDGGQRRHHKLR